MHLNHKRLKEKKKKSLDIKIKKVIKEKGSAVNNGISVEGRRLVLARRPGHLLENEVTFELRPECRVGVSHKKIQRVS